MTDWKSTKSKIPRVITPKNDKDKEDEPRASNQFFPFTDTSLSDEDEEVNEQDNMVKYKLNKDLEDLLRSTFEIPDSDANHELLEALHHDGIQSWVMFRRMQPEAIESLTKQATRERVPISTMYKQELNLFTAMIRERVENGDEKANDISSYSAESYQQYFDNYIKKKKEKIHDNVSNTGPTATHPAVKSKLEKALDSWDRRRHDKTSFDVLKEDSKYKIWKESFIPELKVQGLERMIDPNFDKKKDFIDTFDRELYDKQSNYFWTVLDYALKNPVAEIILGKHRDKSDARTAFLAVDEKMKGKIAQMYNVGELMDQLQDLHISTFSGTRVQFIAHWFETLRRMNKIADEEDKLGFIHVRRQLARAVNTDPDLTTSFTELKDEPDRDIALVNLMDHLLEKATLFDGRDGALANSDHQKLVTLLHRFGYEAPPEILINKARRSGPPPDVKLPDDVYSAFQREDKIRWREMSDTAKRSIVSHINTADRGSNHRQTYMHDYNQATQSGADAFSDPDHALDTIRSLQHSTEAAVDLLTALKTSFEIEANATASTALSSISSKSRPPVTPSNSDSTSQNPQQGTPDSKERLPLKSDMSLGNPARIMASKTDMKKRAVQFHGTGYAGKHEITHSIEEDNDSFHGLNEDDENTTYTVSQRRVKNKTTTALIDRGANGCVAGGDCTWIGSPIPDRKVHITGMDEHQVRDIPIGTVGAYVLSNRGPVICVFHEAAYTGKHQSIISALQLEHYRNRVDDRVIGLGGGQQITTADGYNFPLSIVNGLPYLQMRPYTKKEFSNLPHVIMTSEEQWDPRQYDNYIDPTDKSYNIANPEHLDLLPYDDYNARGDYIGVHSATHKESNRSPDYKLGHETHASLEASARDAYPTRTRSQTRKTHGNTSESTSDVNKDGNIIHEIDATPRKHEDSERNYDELKPFFAWLPTRIIKETFRNSTQFGFMPSSPEGNLFKRWKSPNPAMNVFRLQDDLLTDKVHSNTASVEGGFNAAQVFFGRKSHIIHPEPISKSHSFLRGLQNFVTKWGAPLRLIADHVKYHASFQVLDYLRMLWIPFWFSEAYYQHQNPFERRYQTFKRVVNRTMDRTNTPAELWYLCMTYVAYIMNRTADPTLGHRQPIFVATGQPGDISSILVFRWYEPVYYKVDNALYTFPDTGEKFGYFVGISETVGHQMTYKIWNPDTKRVIERSSVRSALDPSLANLRALGEHPVPNNPQDNGEGLKFEESKRPSDFVYSKRNRNQPAAIVTPDDTNYGEQAYLSEKFSQETPDPLRTRYAEDGTPLVVLVDENGHPRTDTNGDAIMIPGKTPEQLKGHTFKHTQDDGSVLRARVLEPVQSNLESDEGKRILERFRIKYDRTQLEATMAYNDIMNYIHREEVEEEGKVWKFRRILSHRGPLTHRDPEYRHSKYNVSVEWETGETTEEPLRWMIKECPVVMAEYARDNNLLELEGWRSLRPLARRAKKMSRLVNQAKLRSYRTAPKYMYGYQVPRDYEEALLLDAQNGNTKWSDATSLEMQQLDDYQTFLDKGLFSDNGIPTGYKKIRVHLVYAVKHDGRHKARLVADGHLTDLPLNSVYAGVVSIRGLRICLFLAELNGLEAYATDIGNAYLEALTEEKVCIHAGPEFGPLEGHLLIIYKALYGLRSSGKQFGDLLASCLKELEFFPSLAEPQIFMRQNGDTYEYIATYVDDLCLVMKEPSRFLEILQSPPYNFKLKGSGPMSFHLGCGFERDSHGTLCMNPAKYIEKISQSYQLLFGVKLGNKPRSPLEDGDHPELDVSEFLEEDDTLKYQSLIGSLQWLVTLGRWDIQTAVMTLSSFRAKPRQGHLDRAKRVCAYVNRFKHYMIRFRVKEPDLSELDGAIDVDWPKCVYEDFQEDIPENAPTPLGNKVTLVHWFDANLMHDVLSGKAVTGCIHFANKTPIMWYSKKQSTSETATYGAEFCAGRTCIEQIVDLRNTLRYLGVPLHDISYMFGDNKSMVDSASFPYARLHKRHNILSFHYVRSMIARGFIALNHVSSKDNLADVVTKHWGYNSVKGLLKTVFHHAGDPRNLFIDDG